VQHRWVQILCQHDRTRPSAAASTLCVFLCTDPEVTTVCLHDAAQGDNLFYFLHFCIALSECVNCVKRQTAVILSNSAPIHLSMYARQPWSIYLCMLVSPDPSIYVCSSAPIHLSMYARQPRSTCLCMLVSRFLPLQSTGHPPGVWQSLSKNSVQSDCGCM